MGAAARSSEAGLADRVEIRLQDYRDVDDGPFDAISSIGMFEHVGAGAARRSYFSHLHDAAAARGSAAEPRHQPSAGRGPGIDPRRLHGPLRVPRRRAASRWASVVTAMQRAGFEVRHVESLREHYALTLRHWVANLEAHWDEAVGRGGRRPGPDLAPLHGRLGRRLRGGRIQVHQVLARDPGPTGTADSRCARTGSPPPSRSTSAKRSRPANPSATPTPARR